MTLAGAERVADRGTWASLMRRPWPLVLAIALLAAVARGLVAFRIPVPWIMTDELIYQQLARSFGRSGQFLVRGESIGLVSLYPVVLAPFWLGSSTALSFGFSKVLNIVAMTGGSLLLFVWARKLVSTPYALAVFVLSLLAPAFLYTSELMSENLAWPSFILAGFVIWRALQRPTLAWQAGVLGTIALASSIRAQGVVLVAIWATAIAVTAALSDESEGRARGVFGAFKPYWPSAVAILVLGGAYLLLTTARGKNPLGFYSAATGASYSAGRMAEWFGYHLAELSIAVGLVPAVALVVMLAVAVRRRTDAQTAGLLAVAASSVLWLAALAGIWASWNADGIRERYDMYAVPFVLLVFAVFLERATPRRRWIVVAAGVVCLVPLVLPFSTLLPLGVLGKATSLDSLFWLWQQSSGLVRPIFAVVAVLGICVLLFRTPRARAVACIGFVGALFVINTAAGLKLERRLSEQIKLNAHATSWVDQAVGGRAAAGFVWTGPQIDPNWIWQTEFWNPGVRKVYYVTEREPGTLPVQQVVVDSSGRLLADGKPLPVGALVSDRSFVPGGHVLATIPNGLSVTRVTPDTRMDAIWTGLYADRWTEPAATFRQPGCTGKTGLGFTFLSSTYAPPQQVTAREGTAVVAAKRVRPGKTVTLRVPLRPASACAVAFQVSPPFVPSQRYGSPDPRTLGVWLTKPAVTTR